MDLKGRHHYLRGESVSAATLYLVWTVSIYGESLCYIQGQNATRNPLKWKWKVTKSHFMFLSKYVLK